METTSGKVLEEAVSKKEASVAGLREKLSETGAALRQLLSCRPAVQVSPVDLGGVGNHHERFKLLVGLEVLLEECLREVQSIVVVARGDERKKRIAVELAGVCSSLQHHLDVFNRSCEDKPEKPAEESSSTDRWSCDRATRQRKLKDKKRIARVQNDWKKIRILEEKQKKLERGEHLSEEERKSLASAYDAAIAGMRSRMELLLKGNESDDAVVRNARSAADAAIGNLWRRCKKHIGEFTRTDHGSAPASPEKHREERPRQGRRAAHGRRGGTRSIEMDMRSVFEEGGGEKKSTGGWRIYALPSLPGNGTTFATTAVVGMDMPSQCAGGGADAFPAFEFSIAKKATEADAEDALEAAREMVGRCCDALDEAFNCQSRMLSQKGDIDEDAADECLREQFSPDAEQACIEALRLRFMLSPDLEREKVIVYLCNAAKTVVRAVDGEATMMTGKRVKLTAMASYLHMQAELVAAFAFPPFAEIIAKIRDAIHGGTARAHDVGQAVMEAMWPLSENGASSPQAEIREVLPSNVAELVRQLMEELNEQGYVTAHNIVAAEVLLALGIRPNIGASD